MVKFPPTKIFPSLCIAKALMVLLNQIQILKELSLVPSEFKRINLFAVDHWYVVKFPPTKILSSFCTVIEFTVLLNPFQISKKLSLVPSEFKRISLFAVVQLYVVKFPPTKIFPSFCMTMLFTLPSIIYQLIKELSLVPSVFKRVI